MERSSAAQAEDNLLLRVEALEQEKRELKNDIEALCKQQAGSMGAIDVMARLQARRAIGLDQELAASKHKVASLTMECSDLKRELVEAYRAKNDVADMWKVELDKTVRAEEDTRFYQSQAIAALAERDEASFLAETLRREKARAEQQCTQLSSRAQQLEDKYRELESCQAALHGRLNAAQAELDPLRKLAEAVYEECAEEAAHMEPRAKAEALLESGSPWHDFCQEARSAITRSEDTEAMVAQLQEKKADINRWTEQVLREQQRADALKERAAAAEGALAKLQQSCAAVFQQLHAETSTARDAVSSLLKNEDKWQSEARESLLEAVRRAGVEAAARREQEEARMLQERVEFEHSKKDLEGHLAATQRLLYREQQERQVAQAHEEDVLESNSSNSYSRGLPSADEEDSRDALAQALHEKVSALLLMSQQEERYHLEQKTAGALQEAVQTLQAKLAQVTREKVEALLSIAQLKTELMRCEDRARALDWQLQQERSTSVMNRMLPAQWGQRVAPPAGLPSQPESLDPLPSRHKEAVPPAAAPSPAAQALLMGSFQLPSWLRGATAKTGLPDEAGSVTGREDEAASRLRVENAALADSIQSLQNMTQAVHRMRTALEEAGLGTVEDQSPNLSLVESVAVEAKHLRVALGGPQLPVSWPSEGSADGAVLPLVEASGVIVERGAHSRAPKEAAIAAGLEMAELVLLIIDLQLACSRH